MKKHLIWSLVATAMAFGMAGCFGDDDSDCVKNADCKSGEVCTDGSCVKDTSNDSKTGDDSGKTSDDSGKTGDDSGKTGDDSGKDEGCKDDKGCASGEKCYEGACYKRCYSTAECDVATQRCDSTKSICIAKENGSGTGTGTGTGTGDNKDDGPYQVSFVAKFGNWAVPMFDSWETLVIPSVKGKEMNIYTLFCNVDDEKCVHPVQVIKTEPDEAHPIQNTFGPTVKLSGIEPGNYKMFVFADATLAEERHERVEDMDPSNPKEEPWGGLTTMLDMCMVAKGDTPDSTHKPDAAAWDVTVPAEGEAPLDLGDVFLSHYRETDVSPKIETENGRIAVVTSDGIRIIDLNTMKLEKAGTTPDFLFGDKDGNKIPGSTCGMIDTGGDIVWVLFEAGVAIPFDVRQKKQLGDGAAVHFKEEGSPCTGFYHKVQDGKEYLYVSNFKDVYSSLNGLWYADVSDVLNGKDVDATFLNDDAYYNGVNGIAAKGTNLYFSYTPSPINKRSDLKDLAPCSKDDLCLLKAVIGEDGRPEIKMNENKYDAVKLDFTADVSLVYEGEENATTINCKEAVGGAAMYIAGKWLFVSSCNGLYVFDVENNDKPVDMNGGDFGNGMLITALGGQFPRYFTMGQDGYLWTMFEEKSPVMMYYHQGPKADNWWVTDDRHAALPIDFSGDIPKIADDYNKDNIDGYSGREPKDTNLPTPEIDPGVQVKFFQFRQYVHSLSGNMQTAPYPTPQHPSIAVGQKTMWMIGAGNNAAEATGLGQAAQPAVFSLTERAGLLFPAVGDEKTGYYRVYTNGTDGHKTFGFKLNPDGTTYATNGIKYIKL